MCWTLNHQNILEMAQGHISFSVVDWCTGLSGVPPDSVGCTMLVQIQSSHSREFKGALRYNSLDCPVCHRTVRCTSGATANLRQRL
jgi:hypothetical protein